MRVINRCIKADIVLKQHVSRLALNLREQIKLEGMCKKNICVLKRSFFTVILEIQRLIFYITRSYKINSLVIKKTLSEAVCICVCVCVCLTK